LWVPAAPLGPSLPTVEHGLLHQLEEAGPEQENDLEGRAGLAAGSGTPASTTITTTFCSNCNLARHAPHLTLRCANGAFALSHSSNLTLPPLHYLAAHLQLTIPRMIPLLAPTLASILKVKPCHWFRERCLAALPVLLSSYRTAGTHPRSTALALALVALPSGFSILSPPTFPWEGGINEKCRI